jgi:hypothetical protein
MVASRLARRVLLVVAPAVAGVVVWQVGAAFARAEAPAIARVTAGHLAQLRIGDRWDRVQRVLGAPDLVSEVYRAPGYLVQCWYYDLDAGVHTEVCFQRWRVFHMRRYR